MHFMLIYDLAPDYLERRPQFRKEHLDMAWAAAERGEMLVGGALGDPVEHAVLLFQGEDGKAAERFAKADPYVTNGLVTGWRVLPWNTVAGPLAANPVKP